MKEPQEGKSRPETVETNGMDGRDFEAHHATAETRASTCWEGYITSSMEPGQCWVAGRSAREEANDRVRQRHLDQTLKRRKPESMTVHRYGHERPVDGDVSSGKQSPWGTMRGGEGAAMVAEEADGLGGSGGDVGRAWSFERNELLMGDSARTVSCIWENPRSAAGRAIQWTTTLSTRSPRGLVRRKAVKRWRGPNPMRGGCAKRVEWSGAGRSTHARAGRDG